MIVRGILLQGALITPETYTARGRITLIDDLCFVVVVKADCIKQCQVHFVDILGKSVDLVLVKRQLPNGQALFLTTSGGV